jgi:hypothetical protein
VAPRKTAPAPAFRLSDGSPGDGLALEDPTLFVLPHHHSFSGQAWLAIPTREFSPPAWSEPVQYLPLPAEALGAEFARFVQTNPAPPFATIVMLDPELRSPDLVAAEPPSGPSTLRVEGDLARRRLRLAPRLPSWSYPDLLTNSVVQVVVDAPGNPVSAVLLPPGSGLKDADLFALDFARSARFGPEPAAAAGNHSAGLTFGILVFHWQTLAMPATNSPPATP